MRRGLLFVCLLLVGCSNSEPTGPSAALVASPRPSGPIEVKGRIVSTAVGSPLANITVDVGGRRTTTSADGEFAVSWEAGASSPTGRATLTGSSIVTRSLTLGTSQSREVVLDAIELGGGFDLDFYRRFVRNTADVPQAPRALQRWTRAPRVYLKTVDEAGRSIDETTLATTTAALLDDARAWTGGTFGVSEVVRGTDTREGRSGWITVKWPNPANTGNNCGRAQVGVEGGWIELNYLNFACACGGSRVGAGIVRHELGHALGFFHTGASSGLMRTTIDSDDICAGRASSRERFHAAIAYSRAVGNTDVDDDPATTIQRLQPPIVVVD